MNARSSNKLLRRVSHSFFRKKRCINLVTPTEEGRSAVMLVLLIILFFLSSNPTRRIATQVIFTCVCQ